MQARQDWVIAIHIDERRHDTRVEVRLACPRQAGLVGVGTARCHADDAVVPDIASQLAVARALADLAHQMMQVSRRGIESITKQPAHLTG